MQFTHSGLEGWHVGEAEPEDGPRRGEAWLFGIANATRGAIREADAERSPRPGTRDPANEEPPRTNALKPAVPSNAVPASELYHPRGGARYRRTCIEHLMLMPPSRHADPQRHAAQPADGVPDGQDAQPPASRLNSHQSCAALLEQDWQATVALVGCQRAIVIGGRGNCF